MQNHLWCPNDPRGKGIDEEEEEEEKEEEEEELSSRPFFLAVADTIDIFSALWE